MSPHHSQQEREEYAAQGRAVYVREVLPKLRSDDGLFVAVDLDTGEYEIDEDDWTASRRLRDRLPLARVWMERAGHATAYRLVSFRIAAQKDPIYSIQPRRVIE